MQNGKSVLYSIILMLKDLVNAEIIIILQKIVQEIEHNVQEIIKQLNTVTRKIFKYVNCMFKIQTYNLKINYNALNSECPIFKLTIQEEKRREYNFVEQEVRKKIRFKK